jgi:hypothetical protein
METQPKQAGQQEIDTTARPVIAFSMVTPETIEAGDIIQYGKLNLPHIVVVAESTPDGSAALTFRRAAGYCGPWIEGQGWVGTKLGAVPEEVLDDDQHLGNVIAQFTPRPEDPDYPVLTYYAIYDPLPDEDGAPRITFWASSRRWRRIPPAWPYRTWPPKAKFPGPRWKDFAGTTGSSRDDFAAFNRAEWEYRAEVMRRIEADPLTAASRFTFFHSNCSYCGKPITHEESIAYGIGSDCRRQLSLGSGGAQVLAQHADQMRRLYAAAGADDTAIVGGSP